MMKITINKKRYWNLYILAIIYQNIIILMMLIQNVKCDWLMECGNCRCKWNSGKKTADCKNLTLNHVPLGLSTEIQVLDLSYNKMKKIEENAFVKTELENLHKLYVRNCSMERIHPLSFKGLGILIELDISNNLIKQLPRDAFSYLIKVRALVINNNLLEILDNGLIRNLKYLHKIELKENRIIRVNTDVFQNVPYLSQIFLNGNQLSFLRKESFEKLKRLASLSLDSNPWNCTCELQVFRDFALKRNLYTPPTSCYYPIHLRGVLWNDEQSGAFACKPKIIYPSKGASINTSKENVTLICRVHASPNTIIAWDYNKQIYSTMNYQARVHIQLLREENPNPESKEIGRDVFISRLTIIGAEKSDEGIYTCLAENPGGKDEVQMSLLVQKHNAQDMLLHNNLIIVICLMVLGLLSASIFLAMITCCIYKKFKNLNNSHHHHHHHHHHHGGGGSQTSEDSLEHEKRCQAVNSTVVVTNTSDVGYHDTTITDVEQQLEQQQQHQQLQQHLKQKHQQHQNKQKSLLSDVKRNNKIPNGNGLIIDSRLSSITTDLNDKSKKLPDENNTKDSLQKQQIKSEEVTQSNCSTTSSTNIINNATAKLSSLSLKDKSIINKSAASQQQHQYQQQKYSEYQIQENKISEYQNSIASIGRGEQQKHQLQHSKDYQPDLLPSYKSATQQSIPLSDTKSFNNSYTTLSQSNLYDGNSKNFKLEQQPQLKHHETSYSNSNNKNKDSSNILYGQYNDEKFQQHQKLLYQQQQQHQLLQQSEQHRDQNNDIRYASIIPKNKYTIKSKDNDDNEISTSDYLYNTHQRILSSSGTTTITTVAGTSATATTTTILPPTVSSLKRSVGGDAAGSIKGLDSISKLGTTSSSKILNDYLHSGFVDLPSSSNNISSLSSSSSLSNNNMMMVSNTLNNSNGFIQKQQLIDSSTPGIINTNIIENIANNCSSEGIITSGSTGINNISSNSSSNKFRKYQFNEIASYDDRPPTTATTTTTTSILPSLSSSASSTVALGSSIKSIKSSTSTSPSSRSNLLQQNYNEYDNNILSIEPSEKDIICGIGIGNDEMKLNSTMATTTKSIIDDRYYFYENGDLTNERNENDDDDEILPHKQSTIVTTSPSMSFLTNYYPRRELL